jgi:hypothetical protein
VGVNGWWPNEDIQFIQFIHFTDSDDHADLPIAISGAIQSADRTTICTIIFSLANKPHKLSDMKINNSKSVDTIIFSLGHQKDKRTHTQIKLFKIENYKLQTDKPSFVQMSLETNIYLSDTNQRKLILLMTV